MRLVKRQSVSRCNNAELGVANAEMKTNYTFTVHFHPVCLLVRTAHLVAPSKPAEMNIVAPAKI